MAFSLLFGTLFVPMRVVEAGFLSSLFGDQVFAANNTNTNTVAPSQSDSNSQNLQNLPLLSATFSIASILPDQNTKNSKTDNTTDTDANTRIIDNSALQSTIGTNTSDTSLDETSVYVVRKGDTLTDIAKMFDVSVNTILSANDLKKAQNL